MFCLYIKECQDLEVNGIVVLSGTIDLQTLVRQSSHPKKTPHYYNSRDVLVEKISEVQGQKGRDFNL